MARKILLADDSVTAQNMGRKILADAGYDVITVNNGSAALKKIAELKPELIILDVYMPGYSGLEVCQRLKDAHETARVPVLLSVGKLEPFKPEEAKRVRAEGYIVKPFEASELLSALSKLEDRIVPKAEAGKSGRSRAATIDESMRSGDEPAAEGSWKNRISFPAKKKEIAEESPDETALYNAVNRDLKTVVQRSEPKPENAPVAEKQEPQTKKDTSKTAELEEKLVDLGALATAGLPKDVTTEEIAALAAAAAQVKGRELEAERGGKSSPEEKPAQTTAEIAAAQPPATQTTPTEDEVSAAIARLEREEERAPEQLWNVSSSNGAERSTKAEEDLPVTMAASAISRELEGPRWTAVPVALDAQEGAISLEREMQSAFRAFTVAAAAQAGPATSAVAEPEAVSEQVAAVDSPAIDSSPVDSPTVNSPAISFAPPTETEPAANLSSEISSEVQVPAEMSGSEASEFAVAAVQETSDQTERPDYSAAVQMETSNSVAEDVAPQAETPEVVTVSAEATAIQARETEQETKPMELGEKAADVVAEDFSGAMIPAESTSAETIAREVPSGDLGSSEAPGAEVRPGEAECKPAEQQTPVMAEAPSSEAAAVHQEMQQEVREDQQASISPVEVAAIETTATEVMTTEPAAPASEAVEAPGESVAQSEVPQGQAAQPEVAQQDITTNNVRQDESELAATTAAAWASWRQIRDSIPSQKTQNARESANPEPTDDLEPAAAAMAVAAGAEANPSEAATSGPSASGVNSQTVASIVDNLLAELRPKIVEEISKKLAAEKK